jgi:hypothetical protein
MYLITVLIKSVSVGSEAIHAANARSRAANVRAFLHHLARILL